MEFYMPICYLFYKSFAFMAFKWMHFAQHEHSKMTKLIPWNDLSWHILCTSWSHFSIFILYIYLNQSDFVWRRRTFYLVFSFFQRWDQTRFSHSENVYLDESISFTIIFGFGLSNHENCAMFTVWIYSWFK